MLLGVTQGVPHQARVVLLIEGTGGAGDDALSAVDARGLAQRAVKAGADVGGEAPARCADAGHPLSQAAHSLAPAAHDAFGVVSDHMHRARVRLVADFLPLEGHLVVHPVFPAQALELTESASAARQAGLIVDGQDQLQVGPPCRLDPLGIGVHLHPIGNGIDAGRHQVLGPLHLHHADPAGADGVQLLQITQRRDGDPRSVGRLQDGGAGGGAAGDPVDLEVHHIHCIHTHMFHFHTPPHPRITAPNRHFS